MKIKASFDDGSKEDLRLAELMDKYGIHDVIFYIPSDWANYNILLNREPLSWDDFEDIANRFEIGSHTISHPMLTRIPFGEAVDEIIESKYHLEELAKREITSFCYPRGYANDELREVVRKNYKTARNTLVGYITESEDPIWQNTTVHAGGKRRKEYEGTTWLKEGLRLLEEAVRTEGSVYHLWGHSWELTREDGWHDLETLLGEVSKAQ
jgi:peptidoglycan/xylan/chitin deacetylase (PgdA/CDA1 family)